MTGRRAVAGRGGEVSRAGDAGQMPGRTMARARPGMGVSFSKTSPILLNDLIVKAPARCAPAEPPEASAPTRAKSVPGVPGWDRGVPGATGDKIHQ